MTEVLKVENLFVSYGKNAALSDINLTVEEGEYLGIIGPNGGGKTTLISAILGIIKTDSGKIEVFSENNIKSRHKIGYVPQTASLSRTFPITVEETVKTAFLKKGLHPFKRFDEKENEKCRDLLRLLELEKLSGRNISDISGGEFQRLLIARALASDPKMLLLDEPVSNVDPASREKIYSVLSMLNKQGMTILMVTHDLMAVSSSVKKIACLNRSLVYHGEVKITDEISHAMYGCPVDLIAHGVSHRVLNCHVEEHCHD